MYNKKSERLFISTLIIKIIFLILLFVGIPYFLISLSNNYHQKATGILDEESAIIEIETEKTQRLKVLTQVEANTLSKIGDFIVGNWMSEADGRYKIQIGLNNKFEEYYDGQKEGYGVWRVFTGLKDEVDLSGSPEIASESTGTSLPYNAATTSGPSAYTQGQFESTDKEESKYFFQKQQYEPEHKGEKYVYQIQQLDTERFVLVFKGGSGKPLVFVRSND